MKFRFDLKYFLLTIFIFIVEVLIATVFKDIFFVRAFLGDVIVVMLIYTFILSFFIIQNKPTLIAGIFFIFGGNRSVAVLQNGRFAGR